jgi:hypothetical protein
VPDLVLNEDTPLALDLTTYAVDEEDSSARLRWTAESFPTLLVNVTIDDNNLMTVTPLPDRSGAGTLMLVVRDTGGEENTMNVTVTVLPVDDPPVVRFIPDIVVMVTVPYKLDIRPYVSDVDNALNDLKVTTSSRYASVSGFVITFLYPDDKSLDREFVHIGVGDGTASGQRAINVTLKFPPYLTAAPGTLYVRAGGSIAVDLTRYADDRENGPAGLTWTAGRPDPAIVTVTIDGKGLMSIRSVGGRTGSAIFTVAAADTDGNTVNRTITVVVTARSPAQGGGGAAGTPWQALPFGLAAAIVCGAAAYYIMQSRRKG